MDNIKAIFPKRLEYYLHLYDMSKLEFAKAIGISPSAVTAWLKGEKLPKFGTLDKIAQLFRVNRSDLIDDIEHPANVQPQSSNDNFTSDELELLSYYRLMPDLDKGRLLGELCMKYGHLANPNQLCP